MAVSILVKETILGILYRIFLLMAGVTSFPASEGSHKRSYHGYDNSSGLSIVLSPERDDAINGRRIIHSFKVYVKNISLSSSIFAWLPSETSSSWTSSTTGDFIGTESGVHMTNSKDAVQWENSQHYTYGQSTRAKMEEKKRVIPPPITLLRGRGDVTGPRSWFMKKECIDGRVLLKATTIEYFEYMEANRFDGYLQMNLVTAENGANCCLINEEDTSEIVEEDDHKQICIENGNESVEEKSLFILDDMDKNGMPISLAASLPDTKLEEEMIMKAVDTLRKCLTYTEGMTTMNFLDS